jgi:antibiotic biosynthesis monooxygenase (ABM) superfamily enzyme
MWAQIIKTRVKPGSEAEIAVLMDQFKAAEQPDSGLIRSTTMRDQNDPSSLYIMVVFDSEESARAREKDPRREAGLAAARETMGRIFEGAPEFVDLNVVTETTF